MNYKSLSKLLFFCAVFLVSLFALTIKPAPAKAIINEVLIAGSIYNFLAEGEEPIGKECQQDGHSYTKPSPGIGPMPCGSNQCRPDGYLYFTACLTETDCNQLKGTTDGGNKAGCTDQGGRELFCCRVHKNRCNRQATDPNKLFLCTNESQCTGSGGKVHCNGCGCDGDFSTCCEFPDSPKGPMKIIGMPLLKGTSEDPTGTGGGLSSGGGSYEKAKRSYEHVDNFCYTAGECGEAGGSFEPGFGCPFKGDQKQGYCLAPDVEYEMQKPLFGVTKISGLRNLIKILFNGSIGVLIITSAVFFIWGAFKYLVSAVATSIKKSKEIMVDSLVGLALGLGAFAILSNINPNLLNLTKQKVYMINRVSFYDVVYCKDLINQDAKLMYAGTPKAPLSYTAQLEKDGFNKSIDDAECGKEYFIEGADTMAVCMGTGCEGGDEAMCINCTTGLGSGCESNSSIEHACADCKFGGNVVTAKTFKPDEVWIYLFCEDRKKAKLDMSAKELINIDITNDDRTEASNSVAGGYVTNICIDDFDLSISSIDDFEQDCKDKTDVNMGALMFVKVDMEWAGSGDDFIESLKRRVTNVKVNFTEDKIRNIVNETAVLIVAGPVWGSLVIDAVRDNMYFPVNKNMCNTNLIKTSVGMNEGLSGTIFNFEVVTFNKLLEAYAYNYPTDYNFLVKNAWSMDEVKEFIRKGTKSPCGFQVQ